MTIVPARLLAASTLVCILAGLLWSRAESASAVAPTAAIPTATTASPGHVQHDVMESAYCARCHPDAYAEHEQSTHGRAFTDEEVRLATARFAHQDCIICHTPRPIFETGTGMNPIRRHFGLQEGNTCMTCHFRPDYDYKDFQGGAECKGAFHPDVGTVEACASCHRNHGTPYQYEKSPLGKAAGRVCIDCHMQESERPIAVGGPVRETHSHIFPGSRNEKHLRRAYDYDVSIDGDTLVVTVKNKGAGHNFPTELKQRSVESLVVVRDIEGREVASSRMVFRDPYKRPYGLELPVNTQIPSGESREHRVPIGTAAGTIECELFFKLYYPIEDHHPDLSRTLETRRIPFAGITPSREPVVSAPNVKATAPEGISPEQASVANLTDFARPPIGKVAVDIPAGDSPADIQRLVDLFQFPVPEANAKARAKLHELGAKAVPALIDAMGSWDNKTWNQAMNVLEAIGDPAREAVVKGLDSEQLYVRLHARELVARKNWAGSEVEAALARGFVMKGALDRASAATASGELGLSSQSTSLIALLVDPDPDVVRAAALALAQFGETEAVPGLLAAMQAAHYPETRRDLALALARLGNADGIPLLLTGLDHADDLIRESFFEALFEATGEHQGYDPLAPRPERLEALAALQVWWARKGGPGRLLEHDPALDRHLEAKAWKLVGEIGGNDVHDSTPEKDKEIEDQIVALGENAVTALVRGLKFPPGFVDKRCSILSALGRIASPRSAPAVAAALRDPVVRTAAWACWVLEKVNDAETLAAVERYEERVRGLAAYAIVPVDAGPADRVLCQAARTRLLLGDDAARHPLAGFLLSEDLTTRQLAIEALARRFEEDRGYDPEADPAARREAALRWMR